ncbi:MAG TPA: hypothetical protein IGQ44_04560 [Geminocystis sp. M7585_C2015_104]|nr:hypothetical protein [Geminocystis sp. M7585_C2015_104]
MTRLIPRKFSSIDPNRVNQINSLPIPQLANFMPQDGIRTEPIGSKTKKEETPAHARLVDRGAG